MTMPGHESIPRTPPRRDEPTRELRAPQHWLTTLTKLALLPLIFLLGPRVANATIFVTSSAAPLVTRADAIVLGSVRAVTPRWEGRRIVSDVELDVEETVKGAPPQHLTLVAPGGRIGDVVMRVIDGASFRVGDRSILFLSHRDGVHRLVGLGAGKLDVRTSAGQQLVAWHRNGVVDELPLARVLDELKALVAVGAP
jgi:hypothetical protein